MMLKKNLIYVYSSIILNNIPLIGNTFFTNYVLFKFLKKTLNGGMLSAVFLIINGIAVLLNLMISKHLDQVHINQRIMYAKIVTIISSVLILTCSLTEPVDIKSYIILLIIIFFNGCALQIRNLLISNVPFILNEYNIFSLNKIVSLNIIFERVIRGIAPGAVILFIRLDWFIFSLIYSLSMLISIVALFLFDKILPHENNSINNQKEFFSDGEAILPWAVRWNIFFQFTTNLAISGVGLIYLYSVKSNPVLQIGIINPNTSLYAGLLLYTVFNFTSFNKYFTKTFDQDPPANAIKIIYVLAFLFLFAGTCSDKIYWIASFIIGIVYGNLLIITGSKLLKLFDKRYLLHSLSLNQLSGFLGSLFSFLIYGYFIDKNVNYHYLFYITAGLSLNSGVLGKFYLNYLKKIYKIEYL